MENKQVALFADFHLVVVGRLAIGWYLPNGLISFHPFFNRVIPTDDCALCVLPDRKHIIHAPTDHHMTCKLWCIDSCVTHLIRNNIYDIWESGIDLQVENKSWAWQPICVYWEFTDWENHPRRRLFNLISIFMIQLFFVRNLLGFLSRNQQLFILLFAPIKISEIITKSMTRFAIKSIKSNFYRSHTLIHNVNW